MNSVRDIEHRIGERVEALRIQLVLTQSDMADIVNLFGLKWEASTVSMVERGKRALKFSEAVTICRAFDVELVVLSP